MSFGESATRGDREQVGEREESRRNDGGGWKDDERATRSTRIASWTGKEEPVELMSTLRAFHPSPSAPPRLIRATNVRRVIAINFDKCDAQ